MLKPLMPAKDTSQQNAYRTDIMPAARTCEACGKVVPIGHDAINVMVVIGSPGHPALAGWQCPQEQHWACSRECWRQVAHACIDEHMHELLKQAHQTVGL